MGFWDSFGKFVEGTTSGGQFWPDSGFTGDMFRADNSYAGYSSNGSPVSTSSGGGGGDGAAGAFGCVVLLLVGAIIAAELWLIKFLAKCVVAGFRALKAGKPEIALRYFVPPAIPLLLIACVSLSAFPAMASQMAQDREKRLRFNLALQEYHEALIDPSKFLHVERIGNYHGDYQRSLERGEYKFVNTSKYLMFDVDTFDPATGTGTFGCETFAGGQGWITTSGEQFPFSCQEVPDGVFYKTVLSEYCVAVFVMIENLPLDATEGKMAKAATLVCFRNPRAPTR